MDACTTVGEKLTGRHLLVDQKDMSVWLQTLQPGEETQWHRHGIVTDNFLVSAGRLSIDTHNETGVHELATGGYFAVKPGIRHRVRNTGDQPATIVTVQTGGRRDFIVSEDREIDVIAPEELV